MRPNTFLIVVSLLSVTGCSSSSSSSASASGSAGGVVLDCTPTLAESHLAVDKVMQTLRRIQQGAAPTNDPLIRDEILTHIEKIQRLTSDLERCSATFAGVSTGPLSRAVAAPTSTTTASSSSASARLSSSNVLPTPSLPLSNSSAFLFKNSSMEEVNSDEEHVIPNDVGIRNALQRKRQREENSEASLLKNHHTESKESPNSTTSHIPSVSSPSVTGGKITLGSDNMMKIPNLDANTILERLKSKGAKGAKGVTTSPGSLTAVSISSSSNDANRKESANVVPATKVISHNLIASIPSTSTSNSGKPNATHQGSSSFIFNVPSNPASVPQPIKNVNPESSFNAADLTQATKSSRLPSIATLDNVMTKAKTSAVPNEQITVEGLIQFLPGPNGNFIKVMRSLSKEQRDRIKTVLGNGQTLFENAIRVRLADQNNANIISTIRTLIGAKVFNTVFSDGRSILEHAIDAEDIQLLTYLLNIEEFKLLVTPELAGAVMFSEGPVADLINKVYNELNL